THPFMKLIALALAVFALLIPLQGSGDMLLCHGAMSSTVHYVTTRELAVPSGTQRVVAEIPASFNVTLFAYSEKAVSFNVSYSKRPDTVVPSNGGIRATWINPPRTVSYTIDATTVIDVRANGLNSEAQLPLKQAANANLSRYVAPSKYVQSEDRDIQSTARALISNTRYESAAVASIMLWVNDNIQYDLNATSHDAAWTLHHKRGTCENYAHLSLALLRSAGIPARYVNGYLTGGEVTTSSPWSSYGYQWDAGPHSWIEVYYPNLGWVPYEPQKTMGFVDSHHVRESAGVDASELPNRLVYTYAIGDTMPAVIRDSSDVTLTHEASSLQIAHTSAASSQRVISQEMAHGGVVNEKINNINYEKLTEPAVPIAIVVALTGIALVYAYRRRR
ncbi:MAG: transglutaminase-like domain-containing protein, partial [Halobacteriota archaeon]